MEQPTAFTHVDTLSHNGTVVVFGEEWSSAAHSTSARNAADDSITRRLWYRVLDLEQTADEDQEGAWEDATRWTRWYAVPWPEELRPVGLSLLTVDFKADHDFATLPGRWKVISDGAHIYLFRALNLENALDRKVGSDPAATRVYANRYTLDRVRSPDSGTNKAAKGQDVTVPQLRPAREGRYRRSAMRETPLSDTDSQGTRDLGNLPFVEPTMEWSMLRPIDGAFTVTLTPSSVPGRMRWQFFCRWERPLASDPEQREPAVAAFSILRDEDGWADLDEKYDQLNTSADPFRILPDAVFTLEHPDHGALQLLGRPDALTFRLQEQGSGGNGEEDRAISPERVMLAARVAWQEPADPEQPIDEPEPPMVDRLAVLDFGLTRSGAVEVSATITLADVDFARTALWLNSDADRVDLLPAGKQVQRTQAMSVQAWVRHDEGSGTLVSRGWEAGEDPVAAGKVGWAIEWRADRREVVGVRVLEFEDDQGTKTFERFEVAAPAPVSNTWHHLGLVQDDAGLRLYIDGALSAEKPIEAEPSSYEVSEAIRVGGPAHGGPEGSWLDFRIDQVVVWNKMVEPSLETIYVELDEVAREDEALVGYWTFDRGAGNDVDVDDDAGYAASYTNHGADVVSQTAPLFPPEKAEFEKHLAGMSTDMGLLAVPGWEIRSDPRLFIGADGIVRLYTVAREEGATEDVPGGLVYDTTTTRAQFTFAWKAEGDKSTQEGLLILQARKAGPVMNRAELNLEEAGDGLILRVTHPHREDLAETWENLPRKLEDFIAVLNGRASVDPNDEAVRSGDVPLYAYGKDGPQTGRHEPYPSELLQAMPLSVPDVGADALVQPDTIARRQQGNFTGWTRAPLMVSGRFGDADHGAIVAIVDLSQDRLERLRVPGDFGVEAWVRPGSTEAEQSVLNWHQREGDGFSISLEPEPAFAFPVDAEPNHVVLAETIDQRWFATAEWNRCTFQVGFHVPHSGGEGAETSLLTLAAMEDTCTTDLKTLFDQFYTLRKAQVNGDAAALDELETWRAALENAQTPGADPKPTGRYEDLDDYIAVEVHVDLHVTLEGPLARLGVSHDVSVEEALPEEPDQEDEPFWIEPVTGKSLTRAETRQYIQTTLQTLWSNFVEGKKVTPPTTKWVLKDDARAEHRLARQRLTLVEGTLTAQEGSWVDVDLAVDPSANTSLATKSPALHLNRGTARVYVDGKLSGELSSEIAWIAPPHFPDLARLTLGARPNTDDPEPFRGAIRTVKVWDTALTSEQVAGDVDRPSAVYAIDLSGAQKIDDQREVDPTAAPGEPATVSFPDSHFRGLLRLAPTLGERRFRSLSSISTADWLHVAVVCRDNFALRCSEDGQRAVVTNTEGLDPGKAVTIDCVVVPELDDTDRFVFAKAVTFGDDAVTVFRLGLKADGRPWLRYTMELNGERQVHDVVAGFALDSGRAYHVVATVELKELFWPAAKPSGRSEAKYDRYQLWVRDEGIWAYDLAKANWVERAPSDHQRATLDANLDVFTEIPGLLPHLARSMPWYYSEKVLFIGLDDDPEYDIRFASASCPTAIGAGTGEDDKKADARELGWYRGLIGFVRMWDNRLSASVIRKVVTAGQLPASVPDPLAWWRLDENRGLQAEDAAGGKTARLTDETMWTTSRATARLEVYADGRALAISPVSGEAEVAYGPAERFTLGGMLDEQGNAARSFAGHIDEVRVWSDIRTNEEVLDGMHARLGGNEDDLAGWWPVSAGAGGRVKDASGGGNHAQLSTSERDALVAFWQDIAAPVGDDLPQILHLLGGRATSWTGASPQTPAMAAEYGDVQEDAAGRLTGVQKRALVFGRTTGWATLTGFKTGDLDLIYIGQAQSDPTLIGYIEGAPPVPSENLTRGYWTNSAAYNAYSGNSSVRLEEAENTSILFNANYDRGFDLSVSAKLTAGFSVSVVVGGGFAFGGFADIEGELVKVVGAIGLKTTFEHGLSWLRSASTMIGTGRTISNTLALGGSWESTDELLNPTVGRRYLADNVGYALVKSGVANVFAMRLRKNGAMLGLTMVPDPDIPEDFNILTFRIRPTYTKQGTLDGMVGFEVDPNWPDAMQSRGSYFRPREVANLEAEIEAYEAKLLASYDQFDAGSLGRRSKGIHFQQDDPAVNPMRVIEDNIERPYDWDNNLSKRNIVNTYVWTSSGGLFAEELRTTIVRSESSGGSYSFKGMAGVATDGKFKAVGTQFNWDVEALFGGHINTTVVKTKEEGREFGLNVNVSCDDLLERYLGDADQLYSGQAEPGKVQGYRFKSFYLVPDKKYFEHFWSNVVDDDWLESDNVDARALRQAKGNLNHVWRVFHRVTYVNRVPPLDNRLPAAPGKKTRSVVHQDPNWQNIKMVLDVIREGKTSTGESVAGLGNIYEKIAVAVDDLVRHQWVPNAPWWQAVVDGYEADPEGEDARVFRELRQATYEYMKAYYDTGLMAQDPRLHRPPRPPGTGRRVTKGLAALYTFGAGSGEIVEDESNFGLPLNLTVSKASAVKWLEGGGLEVVGDVVIASAEAATKIIAACQATDQVTVEAWIKPAVSRDEDDLTRIVTLSKDKRSRNFTLGHRGRSQVYDVRLRTTETDKNGKPSTKSADGTATDELTHFVFTRGVNGDTRIYINGSKEEAGVTEGTFDNWDDEYRLALANELNRGRAWRGEYHLVAVYSRALEEKEIEQNFEAGHRQ